MDLKYANCVLIGIGATPEHVRADGDILIGTPDNRVLFSKGVMYLNGEQVGFANAEVLGVIRESMVSVMQAMRAPTEGEY
jgi:hypothetical protein